MAFVSHRIELRQRLADATYGVVWRGEGGVDFSGCLCQEIVYIGSSFKLALDMVRRGIHEFFYYANVSAFLKRKLVEFGVGR